MKTEIPSYRECESTFLRAKTSNGQPLRIPFQVTRSECDVEGIGALHNRIVEYCLAECAMKSSSDPLTIVESGSLMDCIFGYLVQREGMDLHDVLSVRRGIDYLLMGLDAFVAKGGDQHLRPARTIGKNLLNLLQVNHLIGPDLHHVLTAVASDYNPDPRRYVASADRRLASRSWLTREKRFVDLFQTMLHSSFIVWTNLDFGAGLDDGAAAKPGENGGATIGADAIGGMLGVVNPIAGALGAGFLSLLAHYGPDEPDGGTTGGTDDDGGGTGGED